MWSFRRFRKSIRFRKSYDPLKQIKPLWDSWCWFTSHLHERQQQVTMNGEVSPFLKINCPTRINYMTIVILDLYKRHACCF